MSKWQPIIVNDVISRYHVELISTNGKERKAVLVLAANQEQAEEHAQSQFPLMHIVNSYCQYN